MKAQKTKLRALSSQKYQFCVPKTQPTRNSSTSNNLSIRNDIESFDKYQMQTCPEVSSFNTYDNSLYTHKLNIDYGHLQQPQNWHHFVVTEAKKTINQQTHSVSESPEQTQRNQINTTQSKNNKPTATKSKSMIKFSMTEQQLQTHPKLILFEGYKKSTPINQLTQFSPKLVKFNPQTTFSSKKNLNKTQRKAKLKEVIASKSSVNNIQDLQNNSVGSTHRNELGKQSSNDRDKDKTFRGAQHCRIVRSYVGGSKMQIKIINYPDCSEYRKVCGYIK